MKKLKFSTNKKNKLKKILLLIISGMLYGFLFPPIESSYFIFIILLPLFSVLKQDTTKRESFNSSFIYGLSAAFIGAFWIFSNVGTTPILRVISGFGMMVIVGTFYGFFGLFFYLIKKYFGKYYMWFLPLAWIGMEHIMLYDQFTFPWITLYNTMTYKLEFIQISDTFGSTIVSFVIVLFNVIIYRLIEEVFFLKDKKKIAALPISGISIFLIIFYYGDYRLNEVNDFLKNENIEQHFKKVNVSLVYPNLGAKYKWEKDKFKNIVETQFKLTETAITESDTSFFGKTDLIIWGETNFPGYLQVKPRYYSRFKKIAKKNKVNLLIGSLGFDRIRVDGENEDIVLKYNSAFDFAEDGQVMRYDKIKLVPFGEVFPYSNVFPFLKNISLGQANFDRGKIQTIFTLFNKKNEAINYTVSICYEGLFSYYNAEFANLGSNFFVNISNDAWYEGSTEIYQHSRFNIYRAVENRRSVVRLANKAENAYIDPSGKLTILFDKDEVIAKTVDIVSNDKKTFFTEHHNIIKYVIIYSNLLLLVSVIVKKYYYREIKIRKNQLELE